jgi:hypothetical protein
MSQCHDEMNSIYMPSFFKVLLIDDEPMQLMAAQATVAMELC